MGKITFQKAKPMQAFFKAAVYGEPGSGKTYTTLMQATGLADHSGGRIAYVDTERGTDFYTEKFDFDAIYTRSLADVQEAVESLDPKTHSVIVIDSISHLWDAAIAAYEGKRTRNEAADGIPMHAWGTIKKPYRKLIRWLMDCPFHVFILGRQKNVFEDDDKGNMKKIGVALRAEGETAYEPHLCCRMEARQSTKDSSKFTYVSVYEKDRTGLLAGRTFPNPSFKTIECVMPLLNGSKQAQSEDPDDVAAKDSALLDKEEAAKEAKSADILKACQELVEKSKNMKELGDVIEQCKAKKRYMVKKDEAVLRGNINDKTGELTKLAAA